MSNPVPCRRSRICRRPRNPPPVGAMARDEQGLRTMVVDDETSMRALLASLLRSEGHEVFEAANGRQALEMALELQPQVMVVNWMMPEMDGIEMTRALRQTKIGRGIYILIVTAFGDDERLIEAFESGVDDFIGKPIKPRVFSARLRGAWSNCSRKSSMITRRSAVSPPNWPSPTAASKRSC